MKKHLALSFVFFCLALGAERAESQEPIQWSVTPYIWASDTKVDLTLRDQGLGGDQISFKDLLDVLDSAFMINVEGGRGHCSERGQAYVDSLHGLMKTNQLMATDDAYLGDGPTILLIPVGDGS
jgi:hypothetical protein